MLISAASFNDEPEDVLEKHMEIHFHLKMMVFSTLKYQLQQR